MPSATGGLTGGSVGAMGAGCAGFTADQFRAMDAYITSSFTIACSAHLTPAGIYGWSRVQARAYPGEGGYYTWTPAQIGGLSAIGASGLDPAVAKYFPPALCVGFHASQIARWQDFYDQHVCQQWSGACLANIVAKEYVGLKQECAQKIQAISLSHLSGAQISFIAPTTIVAFSALQIGALGAAGCSGFTARQVRMLSFAYPADQCSGLTAACIAALTADASAAMNPTCMSQIAPASFSGMGRAAAAQLTADQCATFSGASLNALPISSASALSAECCAAVSTASCAQLGGSFLNSFISTSDALAAFTPACVHALDCSALRALQTDVATTLHIAPSAGTAGACAEPPPSGLFGTRLMELVFISFGVAFVLGVTILACIIIIRRSKDTPHVSNEAVEGTGKYSIVPESIL
jgi:hypothetical protein